MSVPLREAEAATLPGWFSATQAISLWWALMVKGADDVPGLVLDKSWGKQQFLSSFCEDFIHVFITCFCVFNLQQAASCHIYDLEKPATASPDWDINHTNLEERVGLRVEVKNKQIINLLKNDL